MVFTLCVFTHTILQSLLKGSDGFFKTMIIVDGNCDLAVRQVASIHFNNFVSKNWSPLDLVEQSKIIPGDKDLIRQNILVFVVLVPPLLRVQLGDVLCILIGGIGPAGHSTDDLYVLDMTNDKFKWHRVVVQGEGPGPRYGHVRVLISDGLQAEVFGFVASSASSLNMSSRSSLSHYLFFQAFFEGKLRCKGVQATSILVLVNSASLSHEIHIRRTKY